MSTARRAGARIAVTGAGSANTAARAFLRAELDGIRFLAFERAEPADLDEALRETDMLVFVADGTETAEAQRTAAVAAAARERGMLVAAVVVSTARVAGPSPLLSALRDAADMVMIVRDPADVRAVVTALR